MFRKIVLTVTFLHLLPIFILLFSPKKVSIKNKKHISVRMMSTPQRTQPLTYKETSKGNVVRGNSQKTSSNTTKAPSKPLPKKPSPSKKTTVVDSSKPKKASTPSKAIKEIDESLAKIEHKVYSALQSKLEVPRIQVPQNFESFAPSDGFSSQEELLMSFLQGALILPEFGEVKIQLSIKRDGSVGKLVVLKSESQKNKAYLQEFLPRLKFPLALDKEEKTFILTFCNEI